jgi:hypothetical protein
VNDNESKNNETGMNNLPGAGWPVEKNKDRNFSAEQLPGLP